jgi:hypothetical protein
MQYAVHVQGDETVLQIEATSAWAAAQGFAKQVALPAAGWLVVSSDRIETFEIKGTLLVNPNLPPIPGTAAPVPPPPTTTVSGTGNSSYPALRMISVLFKVLAVLTAIVSVIAGFVMSSVPRGFSGESQTEPAPIILGFVSAFFCWLVFWGTAEMIHVVIDIEANTRKTAEKNSK